MKNLFQLAIILTMISIFSACNTPENKNQHKQENSSTKKLTQPASVVTYTCPMHPEIISDKPGNCPKCNMKLKKTAVSEMHSDSSNNQGHSH